MSGCRITRQAAKPASTASARGKDDLYQPRPDAQDKAAGPHQLHIPAADGKPITPGQNCRQQEGAADQEQPRRRRGGAKPDQPTEQEQGRDKVRDLPLPHVPYGGSQKQQAEQDPLDDQGGHRLISPAGSKLGSDSFSPCSS